MSKAPQARIKSGVFSRPTLSKSCTCKTRLIHSKDLFLSKCERSGRNTLRIPSADFINGGGLTVSMSNNSLGAIFKTHCVTSVSLLLSKPVQSPVEASNHAKA